MKLKVFIVPLIIIVFLAIAQSVAIHMKDARLAQKQTVKNTSHAVKNFKKTT